MPVARFDEGLRFDSGVRFDAAPPPPPANRPKRMAKVKLELDNKNAQEMLNASSIHIAAMASTEGTALFPTPAPTVVAYQADHDALADGLTAITNLEGQLLAARNALPALMTDLKAAMEARAIYVEQTTNGDAAKIPISGFAVAGTPGTPIGPLPRPENVKAAMATIPGTIKVSCDPIKGTQTYLIEMREHLDGTSWVQVKISTKSRNEIAGLVSGKNYAFRIAVVGAAGQSPWSDEAVCMAP